MGYIMRQAMEKLKIPHCELRQATASYGWNTSVLTLRAGMV